MSGTRFLPLQARSHLVRTCLAWTADGELSAEDRRLVLELLDAAERHGAGPGASPWPSPDAGMLESLSSAAPSEPRCRLKHPEPS